jgi:hypothetical protein
VTDEARIYLLSLADALDEGVRLGAARDVPEGSRILQMSDTWARGTARQLREMAKDAPKDPTAGWPNSRV